MNPSAPSGSLHVTTEPSSLNCSERGKPSAHLGSSRMPSEPSSRHTQWWDRRNSQWCHTTDRAREQEKSEPVRALHESVITTVHGPAVSNNKKGKIQTNHRVQEKSIGLPRSLTTAEGTGWVDGSRELEKREPRARQPDPTHNTLQGPPPGSCRRSERTGLGISWNARKRRPPQHRSV